MIAVCSQRLERESGRTDGQLACVLAESRHSFKLCTATITLKPKVFYEAVCRVGDHASSIEVKRISDRQGNGIIPVVLYQFDWFGHPMSQGKWMWPKLVVCPRSHSQWPTPEIQTFRTPLGARF